MEGTAVFRNPTLFHAVLSYEMVAQLSLQGNLDLERAHPKLPSHPSPLVFPVVILQSYLSREDRHLDPHKGWTSGVKVGPNTDPQKVFGRLEFIYPFWNIPSQNTFESMMFLLPQGGVWTRSLEGNMDIQNRSK